MSSASRQEDTPGLTIGIRYTKKSSGKVTSIGSLIPNREIFDESPLWWVVIPSFGQWSIERQVPLSEVVLTFGNRYLGLQSDDDTLPNNQLKRDDEVFRAFLQRSSQDIDDFIGSISKNVSLRRYPEGLEGQTYGDKTSEIDCLSVIFRRDGFLNGFGDSLTNVIKIIIAHYLFQDLKMVIAVVADKPFSNETDINEAGTSHDAHLGIADTVPIVRDSLFEETVSLQGGTCSLLPKDIVDTRLVHQKPIFEQVKDSFFGGDLPPDSRFEAVQGVGAHGKKSRWTIALIILLPVLLFGVFIGWHNRSIDVPETSVPVVDGSISPYEAPVLVVAKVMPPGVVRKKQTHIPDIERLSAVVMPSLVSNPVHAPGGIIEQKESQVEVAHSTRVHNITRIRDVAQGIVTIPHGSATCLRSILIGPTTSSAQYVIKRFTCEAGARPIITSNLPAVYTSLKDLEDNNPIICRGAGRPLNQGEMVCN